jgi:hypothetical protein
MAKSLYLKQKHPLLRCLLIAIITKWGAIVEDVRTGFERRGDISVVVPELKEIY